MKRGGASLIILIVSGLLIVVLILGMLVYFSLIGPDYNNDYASRIESGEIKNPIDGLSKEEAVAKFDASFIQYLLTSIKAYNLHKMPLTGERPEIVVYVEETPFHAWVIDGEIFVESGKIENPDIIIRTNKEEAISMIESKDYIEESFNSGLSQIELAADKTTLLGKGYVTLYTETTGKSITGNIARIYVD